MSRFPLRHACAALLVACTPFAVAACGGSSKPDYCTDRAALEQSVKSLTKLSPSQGLSALQTQLRTIQSEANRLVASAKSDFPSETAAIRTSFNAVENDVSALPASPSPQQLAALAADASAAVRAVTAFADASRSTCD